MCPSNVIDGSSSSTVPQSARGARVVIDDAQMIELDAWLHHQRHHLRPDMIRTPARLEGQKVRGEGGPVRSRPVVGT